MGLVLVEQLEVFAFHGHFSEEQLVGRKFTLDIKIETNFDGAVQHDNLDATVNYAEVCRIAIREMKTPSKLIEHVGGRIIKALKKEVSGIDKIELKICKHYTPIPERVQRVCVVLNG